MSSNINPYNIDGAYPIAGQDNDSQGFRDNFTNIRTNLAFAKAELEDLQNKVVLKSALEGSSLDNNLNNSLVTNLQVKGLKEPILDQGLLSGAATIPFQDGHFQKLTTDGPVTLEVINWPAPGQYGRLRLHVTVTNVTHTLQFPASCQIGSAELAGVAVLSDGVTPVLTVPTTGEYVFDLSTSDGGNTVILTEVTDKLSLADKRHRDSLTSETIATGTVSLNTAITYFNNTAAATSTLAAGTTGQVKKLIMPTFTTSGSMVVTVTNAGWKASGSGTLTFNGTGDTVVLEYLNNKWYVMGGYSITAA